MRVAVRRVFKCVFEPATRTVPGRRCRLRLRSFLRRLCPIHRILKAIAERPTARSNSSESRHRLRFSPQCSRLSIADSRGLAWIERRSANFGSGPYGSGLCAARAAPRLPGSRHCLVTQHRGVREARCTGLSGRVWGQGIHFQNGDCLVRNWDGLKGVLSAIVEIKSGDAATVSEPAASRMRLFKLGLVYAKSYIISTTTPKFSKSGHIASSLLNRVRMRRQPLTLRNSCSTSFRSLQSSRP